MRVPDLIQRGVPIVDAQGRATMQYQANFQTIIQGLQNQIDAIAQAQAAADAANAAADAAQSAANAADTAANNAQGAADGVKAETSLTNSYVDNFTPPLISVDDTGLVTILNHDRVYGDSTLNPTVSVTGDTLATGATSGQTVRVYYSDPARAGGAVAYQFTVDPATPVAQSGDNHSVGAVIVPAAGSSDGNPVQPPGWVPIN